MSKYSLETKIKAVHNVLKLRMSSSVVAKLLPTANAVIQRWVARYEELGIDGLSMKSQTYSSNFKVHLHLKNKFFINHQLYLRWIGY